ncbi:suppressor of cytokine signaling 2-like [Exaiptasia diaphana]|uniref:Suppressor of cytokine signaling 2 n=1 Tax=Exaiptasia diaphana TaxID=2652724 RepID=A0A913XM24_EXADI|nr:suppressor of cytokine signaling 2-like [Exaiptasia diaphana]
MKALILIWSLQMCMDEIGDRTQSFLCAGSQSVITTDESSIQCFIGSVLQSLRQSGFYWRGLSKERAESLLANSQIGTFLVRDSSHPMYLFTLTVKTLMGVTNIRIAMENGRFSLESCTYDSTKLHRFENVLQLVTYYIRLSRETRNTDSKKGFVWKNELYLDKPLYKRVCSLQHICRRTIHRSLNKGGISKLPIPDMARLYISKHPFPV